MIKRDRVFKILLAVIFGFYSLLIFHPHTLNIVLCQHTNDNCHLGFASMSLECQCSHHHEHHHDAPSHPFDPEESLSSHGTDHYYSHIIISGNGFISDISPSGMEILSFSRCHESQPQTNTHQPDNPFLHGEIKLPHQAICQSFSLLLC